MASSFKFFGAFLYLARLTTKTNVVVISATSMMPTTIPVIAPPDTFFRLFEFLGGVADVEIGCKFRLDPLAGKG